MAGTNRVNFHEFTQQLQDEREILRTEIDSLTTQLSDERTAKVTLENEIQVKELELLHLQQRLRHTEQTLQEKLLFLTKELEDEKAQHKITITSKETLLSKNLILQDEIKTLDLKWKKEILKKENAQTEIEVLKEEVQAIVIDRDQYLHDAEIDAQRVRELWQQITRENDTLIETLRTEVKKEKKEKQEIQNKYMTIENQCKDLESSQEKILLEKKTIEEKFKALQVVLKKQRKQVKEENQSDKDVIIKELQEKLQYMEKDKLIIEEREERIQKEAENTAKDLHLCQMKLHENTIELEILKKELNNIIDKTDQDYKHAMKKASQEFHKLKKRSKSLAMRKKYADELCLLQENEVQTYHRVLRHVNKKISDIQQTKRLLSRSQPLDYEDNTKHRKSLNIFCH